MPRVSLNQTNFTAGEISPRLHGRTDIDRYGNAARSLVNAYPVIHGGARRREGTRFVQATKAHGVVSRGVPFVFSRDKAYMLIFGNLNLRVYQAGGGSMLAEVVTPYTEAQLPDVDFTQGEDTMFLFHPSHQIQRLRRFSDSVWDLSAAPFTTTPFDEQGHVSSTTLTLSSAAVGAGRTATASSGVFQQSDIGRQIIAGAGAGVITGYTSPTVVTFTITIAFASTSITTGWYMDVSPQGFCVPSAKDPTGATITLYGALTRAADLTLTAKTGAITINASAGVFVAGDTGKILYADSGVVTLTYVAANQCTGTTTADFVSTSYATGSWGITDAIWRSVDVGNFVRVNGGLCKVTSVPSNTQARAVIVGAMTSVVASPPFAWSLEQSVWSAANGYPRTGTLHEQRLVVAGTTKYPQTIWGSRTGEYLDFTKGSNDSDSYSFAIASDEVNPIVYVCSLRNLLVYTYGGEFSLQGGIEKPITPTNVRVRPESNHGAKGVRPVLVGKESLSVQRAGRKVLAMGYDYSKDGYVAPDLTVLAEHITQSGITSMCYQQEPDFLIWATRGDGALVTCTLNRDPVVGVTGWAPHYTDGAVEWAESIPNGERDEVWLLVRRTVNGSTVRYIEILDDTFEPLYPEAVDPDAFPPVAQPSRYGYTVDCGLAFDNVAGQTVFAVPHLIGKAVDIVADGSVQPQQVVPSSGNVTIARLSYRTLIGLHFRSEVGLLTPEVGTGTGTAQGNSMHVSEITMRFMNTLGAKVFDGDGYEQDVAFRQLGEGILDQAPAPFSGIKRLEKLGWERGKSEITIVQDQPLPMHLLSVVRKLTVND